MAPKRHNVQVGGWTLARPWGILPLSTSCLTLEMARWPVMPVHELGLVISSAEVAMLIFRKLGVHIKGEWPHLCCSHLCLALPLWQKIAHLHCHVVACGSLRGWRRLPLDDGMHIFLHHKLFIKLELAGHLKDMLPVVVLCLGSFTKGHEGVVGARCWCGPEGWSVS